MGTAWSGADKANDAPLPAEPEPEPEPAAPPELVVEEGSQKWAGSLLTDEMLTTINAKVAGQPKEWRLLFSSAIHGKSFNRMVRVRVRGRERVAHGTRSVSAFRGYLCTPVVIAIALTAGQVGHP